MHPRTLIRRAVQDALTGATIAGANVFRSKILALRHSQRPAIILRMGEEKIDESSDIELQRVAELAIIGLRVVSDETADDELEAFALEIESVMAEDRYLGARQLVASVDDVTDTLSIPGHGYEDGDEVRIASSVSVPTGTVEGRFYYVIVIDDDTVALADTEADAHAADPIGLADQGAGVIALFHPTAADSVLTGMDVDFEQEGDRIVGGVLLTYDVTYQTTAAEDAADLDDFLTAGVTHNLGNQVHPDEDAEDLVDVRAP